MGKMVYAGVEVETKRLDDGITHVTRITLNGEDIKNINNTPLRCLICLRSANCFR